jgi:transcriptional regulator of acetoin/glycerol metabolism
VRQLANVLRTAGAMAGRDPIILTEHLPEDFLDELGELADAQGPEAAALPATNRTEISAPGLEPSALPPHASTLIAASPVVVPLEALEIQAIRHAVEAAGGNISEASKQLGISRNTIYRKLRWSSRDSA